MGQGNHEIQTASLISGRVEFLYE